MAQPWWLGHVSHSLDGAFPVKAKTSLSMVPQSVPIYFMITSYSDWSAVFISVCISPICVILP